MLNHIDAVQITGRKPTIGFLFLFSQAFGF